VSGPYHFHKDVQEDRDQEGTRESHRHQNAKDILKVGIVIEKRQSYIESREHFTFFFTIDQIVMVLHGDERSEFIVYCVV
jgi:hypothetical protein